MATFGRTTPGTNNFNPFNGYAFASQFTLTESGDISKLTAYLSAGATSRNVIGGIYDTVSGTPKNLLGTTVPTEITSVGSFSWIDMALPSNLSLGSGNYWLAFLGDSTDYTASRVLSSGTTSYDTGLTYPTMPDPFTGNVPASNEYAIYATYTPSAGGSAYSDSLNEPLGISDIVNQTLTINRSISDAMGISDTTSSSIAGTAVLETTHIFGDEGLLA